MDNEDAEVFTTIEKVPADFKKLDTNVYSMKELDTSKIPQNSMTNEKTNIDFNIVQNNEDDKLEVNVTDKNIVTIPEKIACSPCVENCNSEVEDKIFKCNKIKRSKTMFDTKIVSKYRKHIN